MAEPTRRVKLKESGDEMVINERDFNPEIHDPLDKRPGDKDKQSQSQHGSGQGTSGQGTAGSEKK